MRLNFRTLPTGSNIQISHSLSNSECSTARESEPVSDQLDRLNSILSNMMKDLIDTPVPQADSASLSHRKILPYIAPLKLQNLSATQSELEDDSINGFSYALSVNYTDEDRLIEVDFESRLEREFLNQCRNVMILEDFRSHELRSFYRLQDDDFSLENLELRIDSFDSPVSFKHAEEVESSLLANLANDLSLRLGINIPYRNTSEFANSIEELFTKEIKISLKELSELEVKIHEMIDKVENRSKVRREIKVGPFKVTININEVYGTHILTDKNRIAKSMSANEIFKTSNENEPAKTAAVENYIKQLENELNDLKLELSLRPDADILAREIKATMQNAFEEDFKFGDIDTRSTDFRLASFSSSSGSNSESKSPNNLELELKTLKAKKEEINKLKIGVEWQLQELIFLKTEYEQRDSKLKEKEDLLERDHSNLKSKEREIVQQQDLLFKLRKELENIKFRINYERMQLDKDKNEHIKNKATFEKEQKLKCIEALNLKVHIQRLLHSRQELTEKVSSEVDILNEKEQSTIETQDPTNARGRKPTSDSPTSKARFNSGSPSRLSTEIMASMSLVELQTLKLQLENEMSDPSLNETSKTRLEIHISRISTQLADMRYKKTIDIQHDTDKSGDIIHKKINNLDKIQLQTEDPKRAQPHPSCSASSTPQATKSRKPLTFTNNVVDDFTNYISSPNISSLPKETSPLLQKTPILNTIPQKTSTVNTLPQKTPTVNTLPQKTPTENNLPQKTLTENTSIPQKPIRELSKPPTGRTKHKVPTKLTSLNLTKDSDSEISSDNSLMKEDVICDQEMILIEKENKLNKEQVKLQGREVELKNLEKMLEKEKAAISQERYDLLEKEKEWQSTWNKIPDADELIPIIQQGHLQVLRELDAFERKKKALEKDKIEISKYWKQIVETKKLFADQMKEIMQNKKDNIRERQILDKMKRDFNTLLPALQSMICLAQ